MNTTTLALDLATNTGYAVYQQHGNNKTTVGAESFAHYAEAERYKRFAFWLSDILTDYEPELVVFEEIKHHVSNRSAMTYGALRGIMLYRAQTRGLRIEPVGASTLKKWATGKGNAPKLPMVQAANDRITNTKHLVSINGVTGHTPESPPLTIDENDMADAFLLLEYAREKFT